MFSTFGALTGLVAAVALIMRKVPAAYALVAGALVGGITGSLSLDGTVAAMIAGAQSMMPSVLRILASGVLVGALVGTGSAARIADAIVSRLGERFALAATALASAAVCAVGVFIDIAVITVAPVALAMGRRAKLPVSALLIAMIGGGKAGNIISPNPNTIAVADAFKLELTDLMAANLIPALVALAVAVALSHLVVRLAGKMEDAPAAGDAEVSAGPALWRALAGPVTVVALLMLRPLVGVTVDPVVALPAGGLVAAVAAGRWRDTLEFSRDGLAKVTGVAVLLIGAGTLAGIIKSSGINGDMIAALESLKLPMWALSPVSGILMAGATASTTAGATIAAQTLSAALVDGGVGALPAAAMMHAGATVIDSLPHGSFFHATGGSVFMGIKSRLKLIPFEAAVGLSATIASAAVQAADFLR
jgi:GntP family gluconate:H+ symporter